MGLTGLIGPVVQPVMGVTGPMVQPVMGQVMGPVMVFVDAVAHAVARLMGVMGVIGPVLAMGLTGPMVQPAMCLIVGPIMVQPVMGAVMGLVIVIMDK